MDNGCSGNFRFDEFGEKLQRLLPADVTGIEWNHIGNARLFHPQFSAHGHGADRNRSDHLARHVGIVKNVGIPNPFVR